MCTCVWSCKLEFVVFYYYYTTLETLFSGLSDEQQTALCIIWPFFPLLTLCNRPNFYKWSLTSVYSSESPGALSLIRHHGTADLDVTIGQHIASDRNVGRAILIGHKTLSNGEVKVCLLP